MKPSSSFPNPRRAPQNRGEVKKALHEREMSPARSMGQNFLTDAALAAWIVDQAEIHPNDTVIEIGPGLGALTAHLWNRGGETILIEKDRRLAECVAVDYARPGLSVLEMDALEVDVRPFFKKQPVKLVGALPYSVGTEILRRFLDNPSPVSRGVFVLQKEVVDRVCAEPHASARGLLSLRMQARWRVQCLKVLPPDIFVPRPKVESAVLLVTPRPRKDLPTFDEDVFDRLLRQGFQQRRKMLRNLLPEPPEPWPQLAARLGFPESARAQELTLAQWVDLARLYDSHALKDNPQRQEEIFDVVDAEDQVIGHAPRGRVHAEGLMHRAVHLFVFPKPGYLLLQKRSHLKDTKPEKWDSSAAGHLDSGEDYLTAAVRELEEELGIRVPAKQLEKLARIAPCAATGMEWVELFATEYGGKYHFPASEIECVQSFSLEEIDAWIAARPEDFADGFIVCYQTWRLAKV